MKFLKKKQSLSYIKKHLACKKIRVNKKFNRSLHLKKNLKHQFNWDRWGIFAVLISTLVLLPIATVVWMAFFPVENIWPHLFATSLPRYLSNSLIIMVSVAIISSFLLISGNMQDQLKQLYVISLGGLTLKIITFLRCVQYQSSRTFEVSRALGASPLRAFWLVSLPLARPAIAIGTALVMMEALNDFGAVEFFAVQTLTTGIFTVWLEASNVGGAAQIAMYTKEITNQLYLQGIFFHFGKVYLLLNYVHYQFCLVL